MKKKKITIIPQIVGDEMHSIFPSFYSLKNYHDRTTFFIELSSGENKLIHPKYYKDMNFRRIDEYKDYQFEQSLNYISRRLKKKNVYVSLDRDLTKKMVVMLQKVASYDLSYRDAFGQLNHSLEFKIFFPNSNPNVALTYVKGLDNIIPDKFSVKLYVDLPDNELELVIDDLIELKNTSIDFIQGFCELSASRKEIIYYFNNHFNTTIKETIMRPFFEDLED